MREDCRRILRMSIIFGVYQLFLRIKSAYFLRI